MNVNSRFKMKIKQSYKCGVLCFLGFFMATPCFAALKWDKTTHQFKAHALQSKEVVEFSFTNTGEEAITILEIQPGCGCISGNTSKKEYAPNESGMLTVEFNLESRLGAQRKGVGVITSDHPKKSQMLYVSTNIPKTFEPVPKRVIWKPGENRALKRCRIINRHKEPFKLIKAAPVREGVEVELKPIREGYEYELLISPSETISNTLVKITLYPELPEGMTEGRTYSVYALLK